MLPRVVTTFTFWIVGAPAIGAGGAAASSLSHVIFCFSAESGHRGRVVEDFVGRGAEIGLAATHACRHFRKGTVHRLEDLEGAIFALAREHLPVL